MDDVYKWEGEKEEETTYISTHDFNLLPNLTPPLPIQKTGRRWRKKNGVCLYVCACVVFFLRGTSGDERKFARI